MTEVLITSSIIVLAVLTAMSVAQKSVSVSHRSLYATQAAFLLEEGAEVMRLLRDDSWNNISSLENTVSYYPVFSGSWQLSPNSSNVGIFNRSITLSNVRRDISGDIVTEGGENDPGAKLVTITVTWAEGENLINKTLSFYLMDIFS